jgi:hypothetical protein
VSDKSLDQFGSLFSLLVFLTVLQLGNEGDYQVSEVGEHLLGVVQSEATKNLEGFYLDLAVGVLHAVEQHQQVFVARNEGIEVRLQTGEHGASDADVVVSGRRHEEFVQQLVHLDFLLSI